MISTIISRAGSNDSKIKYDRDISNINSYDSTTKFLRVYITPKERERDKDNNIENEYKDEIEDVILQLIQRLHDVDQGMAYQYEEKSQ